MEPNSKHILLFLLSALSVTTVFAQMSTDPRLCGGYQREMRGFLDFKFDETTAPPGMAMGKKFCMWTISPTVPTEQYRYNMTIRNVNLNCAAGDRIGINYFNESSNVTNLGWSDSSNPTDNPLCIDSHEVWERRHAPGTTIVVILYVEEVVYGKGFYLEWEEGYDSRLTPGRPRNTYYSFGKPSVAPNPYFAAGFRQNEISTFGFVKANYTDGYVMDMEFWKLECCEGQSDWMTCYEDYFTIFSIQDDATLAHVKTFYGNETDQSLASSRNGFFIIVKIEDKFGGGGRFTMYYDTVRG